MGKVNTSTLRVVSIKKVQRKDVVYNFSVEGDETYWLNGVASHNCRCQIVPKISDEWAKNALKSEGYEWDQESGEAITFEPDADQKKLGFTALSWNDWLSTVAGVNQ